ncbi:MAG TPA: ATP-binding cassette domain-containing protein [Candidatus Acidoferrales bacterium]|nr:ATP-binding cassette domain-containing protein [Candidatus Acidoferrales bacterium]
MLDVNRVSKSFGPVRAVSELSFQARPGAVFGLLGPNGAGKTTTIRMILDILTPDAGEVRWKGWRVDADLRHTFGYLPEERGLYPKMKIPDQMLFFARIHGMSTNDAKARIDELFEAFGLADKLKSTPAELSKGNQQKVQFIAAILHRPPLLVLDEPFSGFDPVNVEVVKDAVRKLIANGTTVLLSSHRMEQVEELCQDICIIDRSQSVLSGNLAEIKHTWPDRFIRMTRLPDMSFLAAFAGAAARPSSDGISDVKLPVGVDPAAVLRAAVSQGPVDHFEVVEPSLNDIYLHYVKPEDSQ